MNNVGSTLGLDVAAGGRVTRSKRNLAHWELQAILHHVIQPDVGYCLASKVADEYPCK